MYVCMYVHKFICVKRRPKLILLVSAEIKTIVESQSILAKTKLWMNIYDIVSAEIIAEIAIKTH